MLSTLFLIVSTVMAENYLDNDQAVLLDKFQRSLDEKYPNLQPEDVPEMIAPCPDSNDYPVPADDMQPAYVADNTPIYTPAPVYATPVPVHTTSAPVYMTPAPVYATPAPVYATPAPVYATPAPVHTTPAPVHTTPAPVHTTPAPVYATPVHATPAPVAVQPVIAYPTDGILSDPTAKDPSLHSDYVLPPCESIDVQGDGYDPQAVVPMPVDTPVVMTGNEKDCAEVSLIGDATYCIKGPICGGVGVNPDGTACPQMGDVAVRDCRKTLESWADDKCTAPRNSVCAKQTGGNWGCSMETASADGDTITQGAYSVSTTSLGASSAPGIGIGSVLAIAAGAIGVVALLIVAIARSHKKKNDHSTAIALANEMNACTPRIDYHQDLSTPV